MKMKLAALVAPITIASTMLAMPMTAQSGYLTDSRGDVVKSGYGLCWDGVWPKPDQIEACGDKVAAMMTDGDADMDGVPDSKDKCPGTPKGIKVDATGCAADSDGDGVKDFFDKCPGTPKGTKVNADGCEIIGDVTINLVNDEFDFDSATLKDAMKSALNAIIEKIKGTPGTEQLDIVGHTDSSGPEAYNQGLSERRAQSVADYLQTFGVQPGDMTVSGRGEAQPVADNGTKEGRKKNRRVEIMTR